MCTQISDCWCRDFVVNRNLPAGSAVCDADLLELMLGDLHDDDASSVQTLINQQFSLDEGVNGGEVMEQKCSLCECPGVSCRRRFVLEWVENRLILGLQRSQTNPVTLLPEARLVNIHVDTEISINGDRMLCF